MDNNTSMEIRPVRPYERTAWLTLRHELWPDTSIEELVAEQNEIIADLAHNRVVVAVLPSGELAGFIELSLRHWAPGCSTHPVGYIEGWYVVEAHRCSGLGGQLVEAGEAWAKSKGCTEMASDAEQWNTISHAAHEALGYEEVLRLVCFRKAI